MEIKLDKKNIRNLITVSVNRDINSIGETIIKITNDKGLFTNISDGGKTVTIFDGGNILFKGRVVEYEIGINDIEIKAYDELYFHSNTYPTKNSFYGNVHQIIRELTEMSVGGDLHPNDIEMQYNIDISKTILDNVKDLCNLFNYRFYYDPIADTIVIKPKSVYKKEDVQYNMLYPVASSAVVKKTITLTKTAVKYDFTEMYNRVRVYNDKRSIVYDDIATQNAYFVSEAKPIKIDSDFLEDVANVFIESHKYPKIIVKVESLPHYINLLDVVYIDDGKYGLSTLPNKITEIIGIKIDYGNGFNISITLGDLQQTVATYL